MDREIGKSGGQGPGSISFLFLFRQALAKPCAPHISHRKFFLDHREKNKISKIPSIPPLALIGTPASLAKQSKQRFSNRRNSTPVHHPRPHELTSLNLCSRVDDACSGSAPSRRRRRAQVQCHRLTGAIIPSSHPPDRRHATTTAGSVSAQPPNLLCRLPSAVCRLPQPARSPPTRDGPSSCMHILCLFHRRRPPQRAGPLANRPGRCVGRIQTRHSSATSVLPMQHSRQ